MVLLMKSLEVCIERKGKFISGTSFHLPKQSHGFMCLPYKSFQNTMGKGQIACNENMFSTLSASHPPF